MIQINNFNKAKQLLSKAAIINPKHAETHNNLGIVFKKLGKHEKAINCFFKAIEMNSKHPQAYNNLGTAHKELGKFMDAKKYYQKAIKLKPKYANAYNNLGMVFKELEEIDILINMGKCLKIPRDMMQDYRDLENNDSDIVNRNFDKKELTTFGYEYRSLISNCNILHNSSIKKIINTIITIIKENILKEEWIINQTEGVTKIDEIINVSTCDNCKPTDVVKLSRCSIM